MSRQNYENFSQCLSRILEKRTISSSQLSHMLNHKSKTTLFRVLQNQAGGDSLNRVYNQLLRCDELHLTESETQDLYTSLTISQYGINKYRNQQAMWNLLNRKSGESTDSFLEYVLSGDVNRVRLSNFFAQLSTSQHVDIILLNCHWHSVVDELIKALDVIPTKNISVSHYIQINSDTAHTINVIHHIMPIIGYSNYMSYSLNTSSSQSDSVNTLNINAVIIRETTACNEINEYQLLMHNESHGILMKSQNLFDNWKHYLSQYENICLPIKEVFPQITSAMDYVHFTEAYGQMEENRDIYIYKPDIGLHHMNSLMARAAMIDGIAMKNIDLPEIDTLIDRLVDIHKERFANLFQKKKVTHCVYSAAAMKKFAQTGMHTNHFFAMRPFTVTERIEILSHLVNQLRHNGYYNIYLLKEESAYEMMDIQCSAGIGIRFTPVNTNYNLSDSHAESVIIQKEFTEEFIEFFMNELVKKHSHSIEYTIDFFNSLIYNLANNIH